MLLLINNEVLVFKEKGKQKELYKVITVIDKNVTVLINISDKTLTFRNIYVKPYIQLKKTFFINNNNFLKKRLYILT